MKKVIAIDEKSKIKNLYATHMAEILTPERRDSHISD